MEHIKKNKKRAMTLLEVIIAMGVSSIIIGVMITMFTSNSGIFDEVDMKSELQLQAQMAETKLMKYVLECSGVESFEQNELRLIDADNKEVYHVLKIDHLTHELHYSKIQITNNKETILEEPIVVARYADIFEGTFNEISLTYKLNFSIKQGVKVEAYGITNQLVFRNK